MQAFGLGEILFQVVQVDDALGSRIAQQWGELAQRHLHFVDGFTLAALVGDQLAGFLSVYWKHLPPPLQEAAEGYLDIIEIQQDFRRRGVATRLVEQAEKLARERGAYQLRAWSSADKTVAIWMWKALGFSLCPAVTFPNGQEVRGFFAVKVL
jgi:GNAT superfamily N-acetyltransferase